MKELCQRVFVATI